MELARRTFLRLALAQWLSNAPPAIVTAAFLTALLGGDVGDGYVLRNTLTLAGYGAVAGTLSLLHGWRQFAPTARWLAGGGRPPSAEERDSLLRAPLDGGRMAGANWTAGALVFTLVNLNESLGVALATGGTILLAGFTTSALAYLSFERILRPLVARALAEAPPPHPAVPGVRRRLSMAWLLGSGVPATTVVAVAAAHLLGAEVSGEQVALAAAFFSSVVVVVGFVALRLAVTTVATPIRAMRSALGRIEAGDFDTRVAVDDGSEIGLLQAGFNRMASALGTYLDRGVAGHILREGAALAAEEVEVTAMFIDVRDFTGFAEGAAAPDVVAALNGLFERIVPLVHAHGGHVDKFVGDGLLAVFGAPRRRADHARAALTAARAIAAAVEGAPLRIGIGLNSGTVVAGNVGGAGRFEFSVIGDAVNVAARVEAATRETGDAILVTQRTRDLAGGDGFVERPAVALKGKREPVALYAPAP